MTNTIILEARNITKRFPGTTALSDVHLEVFEGEVHALVGENGAGKSTLMNIISGVFPQDEGKIFFMGRETAFSSTKEAIEAGIGFVHQELALCQHITVAENMFMGRLPRNFLDIISHKKLYNDTEDHLKEFRSRIKPTTLTKVLNVAEQQVVEIAKALSLNCKLLILDEPTSSLTEAETDTLFKMIKNLKKNGVSILYISHRMTEIFEICDRVTVLRDGKYINTYDVEQTTPHEIVCSMVGREISCLYPEKSTNMSETLLEVKKFNKRGVFQDINFTLKRGEILGFSGLVGAGRTEIMKAICGIAPGESGEVYIKGGKVEIKDYGHAIQKGLCYLTEDRKQEGLFLNMSLQKNITVAILKSVSNQGIISNKKEKAVSEKYLAKLNIKAYDTNQPVNTLSGGNQQKAVIAKWLSVNPAILIMDEPTRGIDVGAKQEIHNILRQLANEGMGIIIVSSELPEIIGMCDRVIVMHEGVITGELKENDLTEHGIMLLASNQ